MPRDPSSLDTTLLIDGKWHHVAATYDPYAPDGLALKLYLDGRLIHAA